METVSIRKETAAKVTAYMLGFGIAGMTTLKHKGIKPTDEENTKGFVDTLEKYLKSITLIEDVKIIVTNYYFMGIHIEDYEYSFFINDEGEMENVASNGDAFLEKIGFKQWIHRPVPVLNYLFFYFLYSNEYRGYHDYYKINIT